MAVVSRRTGDTRVDVRAELSLESYGPSLYSTFARERNRKHTLIFLFLHCIQPRRDLRWLRLGGIANKPPPARYLYVCITLELYTASFTAEDMRN
jgi:hypothetical protein